MKILTAEKIREADRYTIAHEPVTSISLMERASEAFSEKFTEVFGTEKPVYIFCGRGNNGGDGLAISRLLLAKNYQVRTYILSAPSPLSLDAEENKKRLEQFIGSPITEISSDKDFPQLPQNAVIIDALFGTGLNRPLEGLAAELVKYLNEIAGHKIAVDVPSGLFTDKPNHSDDVIFKAGVTFTFQWPKLAFLFCGNEQYAGEWKLLEIGLSKEFIDSAEASYYYFTEQEAAEILKKRRKCSHKGTYGHALLVGGSYGKIGAALMASKACLRSGPGLLTAYIPAIGYSIFQTALPEAMVITDRSAKKITQLPDIHAYDSIAVGPGMGTHPKTADILEAILESVKVPLVLDADALNILAANKEMLEMLPPNCILTPHPKEFERIAGPFPNEWERLEAAREFARRNSCILVLKGAYTAVNLPDGNTWFNGSGNPGMATGGTGDALTGIIGGLLAQGYTTADAARLGVYMHGLAGDIAAAQKSEWSMLAGDLIENLGEAFLKILSIKD